MRLLLTFLLLFSLAVAKSNGQGPSPQTGQSSSAKTSSKKTSAQGQKHQATPEVLAAIKAIDSYASACQALPPAPDGPDIAKRAGQAVNNLSDLRIKMELEYLMTLVQMINFDQMQRVQGQKNDMAQHVENYQKHRDALLDQVKNDRCCYPPEREKAR